MPYTIRITPPEIRQKAQSADVNAQIVEQKLAELIAIVDRLRPTFLGETASAFFKEFDSACHDITTWDTFVHEFAAELRDAANKLEAADRNHG